MRPSGHANAALVKRINEASGSWLLLWAIYQQFGSSPDGAVERDMLAAEDRLLDALKEYEWPQRKRT